VGVTIRRAFLAAACVLCLVPAAGAATYARGIDVSNWQGSIDWLQVAGDGYTFAFAKATEGTGFTDVTYAVNRAGTQGLGLRIGAYHFARPEGSGDAAVVASAIAQADHFVDVAQPRAGDLPPVLDLEQAGSLSQTSLASWTQAWLDEVAARTGLSPLVYSSPNFWKTKLGDTTSFAADGTRLWLAHWTKNVAPSVPASNWNGLGWSFWQWSNCEKVPGILHCVDADRVNVGDPAPYALKAFPGGVPAPSTPPSVVGTGRAGAKLAGVPGTWSGGKPVAFGYQWQRCDGAGAGCAPILGATLETYTPSAVDVGHALVLAVTATSRTGSATAVAPATAAIGAASGAARPAALAQPQVTGTPVAGQALTASAGTWSGSPKTFAYQWQRCDGAGAACAVITGATASTYLLTPGDIGATLSLLVTATGAGGSQSATAPTTAAVAAAPIPAAVAGSLVAQAGSAGAVVTSDSRATVTWQPGAVPTGTGVSLGPIEAPRATPSTGVTLALAPAQKSLPWPVSIDYAAAPAGSVVGYSVDGVVWRPVASLATPLLSGSLLQGAYTDGTGLHVLTRQAGSFALFRAGAWGDPSRISRAAPRIQRLAPLRVKRQRDGSLVVTTRLSTPSQVQLKAAVVPRRRILPTGSRLPRTILAPGSFPVQVHVSGRGLKRRAVLRIRLSALDPWGRTGAFTLAVRVP
jgi:GH25 family lysozyme M1 (1,4-beta-N-acetylmuramidase)